MDKKIQHEVSMNVCIIYAHSEIDKMPVSDEEKMALKRKLPKPEIFAATGNGEKAISLTQSHATAAAAGRYAR